MAEAQVNSLIESIRVDSSINRPITNNETMTYSAVNAPTQSEKEETRTCKYHLHGKCIFGTKCKFQHPKLCRYHMKGQCRKGKKCNFNHPKLCPKAIEYGEKHKDGCKQGTYCSSTHPIICHYVDSTKGCRNGKNCKFRHPNKIRGLESEEKQIQETNEYSSSTFLEIIRAIAALRKRIQMTMIAA